METLLHNKWIWGCVALLILEEVIRRGKPALKGAFGETIVSWLLSHLPKDQYKVIHNIMLKTERGTSQVDHVVVSIYGIFVIEVKKNIFFTNYHFVFTNSRFLFHFWNILFSFVIIIIIIIIVLFISNRMSQCRKQILWIKILRK